MPPFRSRTDVVQKRLAALVELGSADFALLDARLSGIERSRAGTDIVREGARLEPRFLLDGWACRYKTLPDGRRQIIDFVLPGDLYGYDPSGEVDTYCAIAALTNVETIGAEHLMAALAGGEAHLALQLALRLAAASEKARLYDQIVRIGRRTALERIAHLLLELHQRLSVIGAVEDGRFSFPLTQEALADATGLSIVHINRTLQHMRRQDLIGLKSGMLSLRAPEDLASLSDFKARPTPTRTL